jgi:sulfatase maturation enzyme AslB (radical SAM superfamily)
MSTAFQRPETINTKIQPFRVDVQLHDLLKKPEMSLHFAPSPRATPQELPVPVFPQHPELLTDDWLPQDAHGSADNPYKRHWTASQVFHAMRGWMFPYFKSRLLPGDFHPIIAYLFTEWKCNLDCHYCWAFDNTVKGMSEHTAKRSIDWLHSTTCRVLALMGGEPLLRPDFAHKVVYYAAKKGFWVYVPTNARLLRPSVIDRLADAGVATVNFAVDTVDEKPGLPKALNPVRKNFDYLIRKQYCYGYTVFFNMNICRTNLEDIQQLTEIAHANGIATDYHINESPMIEQPHFKHLNENSTFITKEDWPKVDALIDWIIEKNKSRYKMVNSVKRLQAWPHNERQIQGFGSLSNLQAMLSPRHVLSVTVDGFSNRVRYANINSLVPQSASSNDGQRGVSIGATDSYQFHSGALLSTLFQYTRFDSNAHGQGANDMLITPEGWGGDFFNAWARASNQYEFLPLYQFPKIARLGRHELKAGMDLVHRSYTGSTYSHPIQLLRQDGSLAELIDFLGGPSPPARDTEVAEFLQDHWSLNDRLAPDLGGRLLTQSIGLHGVSNPSLQDSYKRA